MKLKVLHPADVAEIQKSVTRELKKVQKEEFSIGFQKLYDRLKACIYIYANGTYFELTQGMCLSPGSSVGIATDYGLDGPRSNPGGDEIFPPVQAGTGAHPTSSTMGIGSSGGRGMGLTPTPI